MILWGLVFGRWWWAALISAAIAWPVLLVLNGVMGLELALVGAMALGIANAMFGIALHQAVLQAIRRRNERASREP